MGNLKNLVGNDTVLWFVILFLLLFWSGKTDCCTGNSSNACCD